VGGEGGGGGGKKIRGGWGELFIYGGYIYRNKWYWGYIFFFFSFIFFLFFFFLLGGFGGFYIEKGIIRIENRGKKKWRNGDERLR
jgi:hypothetical protein